MLIGILPTNIFAEVKKADWTIDEQKEAEMSYWKLSNINDITVVANAEGIKTPSINYIGTYVNEEGRTVIRLSYRAFQNLASGVWSKALFKFDSDLYKLIDFTHAGTGMYKGTVNARWHDHANYNEVSTFTNVVSSTSGAVNVKEQNLDNNKNKTGANARLEIPIDLVLKDGKTVDNLVGQPHIQMRITNDDYSEVFCVAGTGKASSDPTNNDDSAVDPDTLITPYNSYTFMTYVPSKNNNADVNTVSDFDMDYQFYSANSYAKYNEEGGYIDVFHKQSKMNSADNIGGESFAFRQVFNEKFAEVLKPQDESGTVAEVFTASQQGDKWGTTKPIYITKAQLNTFENSDLNPGFTGIQVASTYKNNTIGQKFAGLNTVLTTAKPQDSFLNSATTEFNSGLPTITRYYIDKDKVAEKGLKLDDLASFDFYSTFILDGTKKFIEYTATNDTGDDIVLAPNSVLGLTYADNKTSTPNTGLVKYSLTFGDDAYKIELRSNFKHTGKGLNYEYNLIPGMTIKAGEKITFRTMKYNTPPTSVILTLPGKDGDKKIVLEPGENGAEVNTPRRLNFVTTYAGGSATQSGLNPDIDELFTDSENITGRTRYELAVIKLFYPDGSEYPFTIADQDTRTEMNINGAEKNVNAYTFTTYGKTGFTMPAVVKDSVIGITNTDVRKAAVPSEKVEEKVQAKVTFDLNGGKLPTETKSFEGYDEKALPGTEFAYKLERAKETDPVVRIAPMNELAASDADYTPNGFKVEKYIDHNGDELKGDALELRKIVEEKPTIESADNLVFLGWTTKKVTSVEDYNKLEELKTAEQAKDSEKTYKFTENSPILTGTTVYAFYGPEKTVTTVEGEPKEVEPNGEAQDTGLTIKNQDEETPTTVTAKDEDNKDVTVTVDPETGKITVTPSENVDGPITVTVKDGDFDKDKTFEVPVKGHEKGRDDNNSGGICYTQDGLQKQFEDAANAKFGNIRTKKGVYEASYDSGEKNVTVKILDKTKPFSELKGTGLIAGLTELYKENYLVKVQIGSQPARDLVDIRNASSDDAVFMQNIAQIVGSDIGNEINGQGSNIKTLDDFINKTVELKLTVEQKDCDTNPVDLTYTINGVDGAQPAEETDAEKNPAVEPEKTEVKDKDKLTDDEKKSVEDKVKDKNPEAEKVEVGNDGSVTITYPDDSTNTLTPDQTVTEKPAEEKTDAEKNPAVAPEKTEVKDKKKLTDDEKKSVEDKVKEKNPEAEKVEVGNDGSVTITYPDDSTNTLTPDQTVTEKGKDGNGTSVDNSNLKPVKPTDEKQDTGINVENKDDDTKISAKDEDGKNVPVEIDENGNVIVTPGEDVDGPITVVVEDPELLGGRVEIEVDVIGHAKGRDDNYNGYPSKDGGEYIIPGIRYKDHKTPTYPVKTVAPEKTEVGTPVRDTLWYVFRINDFEYDVVRNGVVTKRKMDVTPVLQNDRTMLPLRYVAEALQADVTWDAKTRTATFTKDGLTASIQIDSDEIVLSNGKTVKMDSKPLNINDRILVSVTNVANVFGLTNGNTLDKIDQDIEWEQEDKSATIYIRR